MTSESLARVKYKRGQNPKSRANLKPFPPGQNGDHSHNGYTLTSALKDALDKPLVEPAVDAPVRDHIVYATIVGAKLREAVPFRECWDRTEGKVTGEDTLKADINITVRWDGNRNTTSSTSPPAP